MLHLAVLKCQSSAYPKSAGYAYQGVTTSIKLDSSGRRSIQVEAEVPGAPEQVWEAIATGPGIGSWFYPTDLEERVGGVLKYDTGSEMVQVPAKVAIWDPPRRFQHDGKDCGPLGAPRCR